MICMYYCFVNRKIDIKLAYNSNFFIELYVNVKAVRLRGVVAFSRNNMFGKCHAESRL